MIGLDTNIIIRYLTQDDLRQAKIVNKLLDESITNKKTLWISLITLCECSWVLEKCYEVSKPELIEIFKKLLEVQQLEFEGEDIAWEALKDFEDNRKAGFADCLIGRQNIHNKCQLTYSFDRHATGLPSFKLLS